MINLKDDEIKEFLFYNKLWVKEDDQRGIKTEINKIKKNSAHIDYCWIYLDDEKVGVVRIRKGSFFRFGLKPDIQREHIPFILEIIIKDVNIWRPKKLEAFVHEDYKTYLLDRGFKEEYSRLMMELDPRLQKHPPELNGWNIESLNWRRVNKIAELFQDAYSNSIDELIGMFNPTYSKYILSVIKKGEFGKVNKEFSYFVKQDKEYVAGLICTEYQNELFLVIIGVKRAFQAKGLGKNLILKLIEDINKSEGFDKITLWVTFENTNARELYLKIGFNQVFRVYALSIDPNLI